MRAEEPLDRIITSGRGRSDLIAILREAQDAYGCLMPALIDEIARRLKITYAEVYGVVTFYEHFHREPRGAYLVRVCRGTACHVRGAEAILHAVQRTLGIRDGETTPDGMFTIGTVACLGTCSLAPVMMVGDQYFGKMTPEKVETVFSTYREARRAAEVSSR